MRRGWIQIAVAIIAVIVIGTVWLWQDTRFHAAVMRSDPDALLSNRALADRVIADGRRVYSTDCASCHAADAEGRADIGAPNLRDRDYLYGDGTVSETEQIVLHGIRSGDTRGRNLASMPAFGRQHPYALYAIEPASPTDIKALAAYLHSQAYGTDSQSWLVAAGHDLYTKKGCWDCHGNDAKGDTAIGAPNLVDKTWLYGDGSEASIAQSISYGRQGQMPAYARHLSALKAREVSAYVIYLSRGKEGAKP